MADALVLGASSSECGFKSHLPHHRWAMKKILPKKPPILSGVSPFLRSEKNLRFCECENGAFSFVAGCELPEN